MKINRLLDPITEGANGSSGSNAAQTTTTAPAQQTQTTEATPAVITDPGTQAREAREARIAKEQEALWSDDAPKVEEKKEEVKVAPAVTTQAPLTAQQIAAIAAETVRASQPVVKQVAPQLTQEEIDKQLGVVKVTPEMCVEMGLPAEAAPFLDKLQKSIVTNAVRMANVIIEQKAAELNSKVDPHISFAQRQQHIMLEHQFREANPDLKGYEPIVNDIAAKLKQSGFRGNQEQAFQKIAEETRKYLKGMGIDPATKTNVEAVAGAAASTTSKPNMSTVSAGSQGGAGGAPKQPKKESWADVWEK